MTRAVRFLGQWLLIGATGLLLLEGLLIVFNDTVFERSSFMIYDRDLGFRVKPHRGWAGGLTNSLGFNDVDYPFERRPGTYRIVVLGDSFSWAGGSKGNYTNVLEELFARSHGSGVVEVINVGFGGTHTGEQLKLLRKFGMQYRPDLVVLSFFTGNDIYDATASRRRIIVGSAIVDIDTRDGREWTLFGQPLVARSRFLLALRDAWTICRNQRAIERESAEQARRGTTTIVQVRHLLTKDETGEVGLRIHAEQYLRYERGLLEVAARHHSDPRWAEKQKFAFANVRAVRDFLHGEGVGFVVAALPAAFHIDPVLRGEIGRRFAIDIDRDYDLEEPMRALESMCEENGIAFTDLSPSFRAAAAAGEELFQRNDTHYSLEGNRTAAQHLSSGRADLGGVRAAGAYLKATGRSRA